MSRNSRLFFALFVCIVCIVSYASVPALAEVEWGLTSFDLELGYVDSGIDLGSESVGGAIGFQADANFARLAEHVVLEGGVMYWSKSETIEWQIFTESGSTTVDFSDLAFFSNVVYEFESSSNLHAFAGGGLGLHILEGGGSIEFEGQGESTSEGETEIGFQLMGGAAYDWREDWQWVGEVYLVSVNSTNHPAFMVGLRRLLD